MSRLLFLLITFSLLSLNESVHAQEKEENAPSEIKWGHSRHGQAYDTGPRQKPWPMPGVGRTPFPITAKSPEVQKWFDQGTALLHGFWQFEAERAFRWCAKLDPDCAMAYLGMARSAGLVSKRGKAFLEQAAGLKSKVSERECRLIELFEAKAALPEAEDRDEARETFTVKLDKLLIDYPDDIEIKAIYWLEIAEISMGVGMNNRSSLEAVLQQILAVNPDHVGALHYRIHNWDGKEGHYAVDSCIRLPELGPDSGHLQHMPGHVLSGIGLWQEAAIAMDSATRVEKQYMNRRMIMPEQNWDYAHNLDYLCYIQEQLGMREMSLLSAKQLLLAPAPASRETDGPGGAPPGFEKMPMLRAMVKFEQWEELLESELLAEAPAAPSMGMPRPPVESYAKARALIGLKRLDEAEKIVDEMREKTKKSQKLPPEAMAMLEKEPVFKKLMDSFIQLIEASNLELEARIKLAQGNSLEGIELLTRAARLQEEHWHNDPPRDPTYLYNALGEAYLDTGSAQLAAAAFERTLKTVFHDGFALSGLVQAYAQMGEKEKAREALAKLRVVWSDADKNRWLDAALATGIEAEPRLEAPVTQRNYKRTVLDKKGPSLWTPTPAPNFSALNSKSKQVGFDQFPDKNIVLIFYLGEECTHCVEQLVEANKRAKELGGLDAVVIAVSKDSGADLAEYEKSNDLEMTLLTDPGFANAKRYQSYDDFEEIELHSTILIDKKRRIHWARTGGEPFMDFDYLISELKRMGR
jgi:peroxiredoxin